MIYEIRGQCRRENFRTVLDMNVFERRTERMDIIIDEAKHEVLIKQRWRLMDLTSTSQLRECFGHNKLFLLDRWKQEFQDRVRRIIEDHWNLQDLFLLKLILVEDETAFYRKNRMAIWTVRFQIDWVVTDAHWSVLLSNSPCPIRPSVDWETRLIRIGRLDTNLPKANPYTRQIDTLHGSEYNKVSPYRIEERVIVDIGAELRFRYIDCVLLELETMIPSVKFEYF